MINTFKNGFLLLLILASQTTYAASCSPPKNQSVIPDIQLETVVNNVDYPVHIANDGFHKNRIYIVEQDGLIQIISIDKKQKYKKPFLDITHRVSSGGERGLLSVAFHPNFPKDNRIFVNYTARDDNLFTIISEFTVANNLLTVNKSERILLKIKQPYENHNGGQISFGPDGFLYIGMGDGGDANDPYDHGQNKNSLLGAILRIDINKKSAHMQYSIPADNPFVKVKNTKPEIWAYGLRNPWRFSFDAKNGDLWTADVGQDDVEEINIIKRDGNYGWRIMEGDICTPQINKNCSRKNLKAPVYTYGHDQGRSITGGMVYRGNKIPGLCGTYIFGDYVMQRIWGIRLENKTGKLVAQKELVERGNLAQGILKYVTGDGLFISSFGFDKSNELYVAAHRSGKIYKIVAK